MRWCVFAFLSLTSVTAAVVPCHADTPAAPSLSNVVDEVNRKVVKLYGSGGFGGINAYGSGVLISADGFILTVASPLLDTSEVIVHLYDGRRLRAKVVVAEPELDAAVIRIEKAQDLPYFDIAKAAKAPRAQPGDTILAFSNQFEIATREEPLSVQHGVIAAYAKLHGRRGIFEAPYTGEVYVLDAITNNPGAAGGAVTTRRGELIGIIGKELQNTLSDTWINYAVPVQALASFVEKAKKGEYKPRAREKAPAGPRGYHGIVLVPNVVERTPPFVEDTIPGSPGERAGLRPDDLIVYVNGEKIVSIKEFKDIVEQAKPGAIFKLEIRRGDRLTTVDLKLDPLPPAPAPKKR
jgi:serine protease Do